MINSIKQLIHYRELLWLWTWREVRSRYRQSILGALWAILQPLVLMVVFNVVFANFLRVPSDGIPYPIFSYSALLFWVFFSTSISFGTNSLVTNMSLLKKVYFPREILAFTAITASFFDLLISAVVFVGLMIYYQVEITLNMLWILPLLTLQTILIAGVVLFGSSLNVFYRDLRFVVPLGVQLWMYATPIIYPISIVPERYQPFLVLNPMVGIIEGYRSAILQATAPDWSLIWPGIIVSLVLFVGGYVFFKQVEWSFADVI